MSESDPLSLAELEAYGRVWGSGRERRALCPFCGDDHGRDNAHASLAFNAETGAWTCHRCSRGGLLEEFKTLRESGVSAAYKKGRRTGTRRRPAPPPREPSPAELDEAARKRARLRRLWSETLTLDEPLAVGACRYLAGRGIPSPVAQAARVRFASFWGSVNTFQGPAVVFPMQDAGGRLVAAEGRFMTPPAGAAKTHSAGSKSAGVFEAMPGALDADGVTVCEGPITALSVAACGYPALALCGKSSPPWLLRRLALRSVLIAFDEGEQGTEEKAAALAHELALLGAKPYRLRLPAGVDVNDYLQAAGLDTARAALGDAICAALASPRA